MLLSERANDYSEEDLMAMSIAAPLAALEGRITQLLAVPPAAALPSLLPTLRQLVALVRLLEARVSTLDSP